jgi:hypothetical protein
MIRRTTGLNNPFSAEYFALMVHRKIRLTSDFVPEAWPEKDAGGVQCGSQLNRVKAPRAVIKFLP